MACLLCRMNVLSWKLNSEHWLEVIAVEAVDEVVYVDKTTHSPKASRNLMQWIESRPAVDWVCCCS